MKVIRRRHKKTPRKRYLESEVVVLECAFRKNQYPEKEVKGQLAHELNRSNKQIQIWFQNRRAREKKRKKKKRSRKPKMVLDEEPPKKRTKRIDEPKMSSVPNHPHPKTDHLKTENFVFSKLFSKPIPGSYLNEVKHQNRTVDIRNTSLTHVTNVFPMPVFPNIEQPRNFSRNITYPGVVQMYHIRDADVTANNYTTVILPKKKYYQGHEEEQNLDFRYKGGIDDEYAKYDSTYGDDEEELLSDGSVNFECDLLDSDSVDEFGSHRPPFFHEFDIV